MISGRRSLEKREPEHVSIGLRPRPHDPCMLDGLVVRRGANAERADIVDRQARVEGDA